MLTSFGPEHFWIFVILLFTYKPCYSVPRLATVAYFGLNRSRWLGGEQTSVLGVPQHPVQEAAISNYEYTQSTDQMRPGQL